MRTAWVLLGLAACYSPRVTAGAPCDPALDNCPSGQVCTKFATGTFCGTSGAPDDAAADPDAARDAAPDGSPFADTDGDGITDDVDNCITVANKQQYNEDGDRFGDACDPCPPIADDAPHDADGDGVADACDPNPNINGDTIALFEGFNNLADLASWTKIGTWTIAGGGASVTVQTDERAYLSPPLTPDARGTVGTAVTPMLEHGTLDRGVGVANPLSMADGIECELLNKANDAKHQYGLVNLTNANIFESRVYPWMSDMTYGVAITRSNSQFECAVVDPANVRDSATDSQGADVTMPRIAVRTRSIDATFLWMMYIDSP